MGALIIGDVEVEELGPKFINWRMNGWDATQETCVFSPTPCIVPYGQPPANGGGTRRYALRPPLRKFGFPRTSGHKPPPPAEVAKHIRKFVLHHDGLTTAEMCWNVLQNERGLSCHFLIDNDGTIYQTLDLAYMGYHAAIFNRDSIGVEICSRGDATKYPDAYARHKLYGANPAGPVERGTEKCRINNHTILGWKFDQRQVEAMRLLATSLRKHLPNLPLEFPRDPTSPSKPYWNTMGPTDPKGDSYPAREFAGYIAHYHLTTQKWDPGPFNFKDFIEGLRGERVFPVWSGIKPADQEVPKIPSDKDPAVASVKLAAEVQKYLDLNEKEADGGFFPVGPWGVTRLWHGGTHLPAEEGSTVFAPFPGRVVAARTGRSTDIGSTNFVLLRHDLNIASRPMRFWSLYMHVQDEPGTKGPLPWMEEAAKKAQQAVAKGESAGWTDPTVGVVGYDEPVKAGDVIGRVDVVGPGELSKAQIHFEIFSRRPLFPETDPDWTLVDGSTGGRFCESPEVNDLIDADKDGRLSRPELASFYAGGLVSDELRKLVTYHVSEWTDSPPWRAELEAAYTDFKKKTGKKGTPRDEDDEDLDIDDLVATQLDPFIWWTGTVAEQLGLPPDGVVYHYHPMRLLERLNLLLLETGKSDDLGAVVSTDTLDVSEDAEGKDMFHTEEVKELDDQHLKYDDLVQGWKGDHSAGAKGGSP